MTQALIRAFFPPKQNEGRWDAEVQVANDFNLCHKLRQVFSLINILFTIILKFEFAYCIHVKCLCYRFFLLHEIFFSWTSLWRIWWYWSPAFSSIVARRSPFSCVICASTSLGDCCIFTGSITCSITTCCKQVVNSLASPMLQAPTN